MPGIKKLAAAALAAMACSAAFGAAPKYVFLFIGDGMSTPQRMVAESFAEKIGYGRLAMNSLPYQANTRTQSANSIITDSAAAATAIACGEKTRNGMVGVDPSTNRLFSVAEAAKKSGRKVGIVTTVTICHATPAGFYAHRPSRGMSYEIGLDMVDSGFDYFCGGGIYSSYDDRKSGEYRGDIRDLARAAGYAVTTNRAEWAALRPGGKAWSIFGDWGMEFAIDRDESQPSLAEIVAKGIELLDNPAGFFIMCEGGKVDYAGHANDAATNLRDVIALDEAVKTALEFQRLHPEDTLVITTGDHETGGLSMGFAGIGGQFRVELLKHQKVSVEKFSEWFKSRVRETKGKIEFEDIKPVLTEKFGLLFPPPRDDAKVAQKKRPPDPMMLTKKDVKVLEEAFQTDVDKVRNKVRDTTAHDVARNYVFAQTVKNVLNAHAGVGWSSGSHTALPTFTTASGPRADIVVGMQENTDLGRRLRALYEEK